MTDITQHLPENSPVVDAIYAYHKNRGDSGQFRQYLGMSEIGGPCERALWYKFKHCCKSEFSGRLYRLFETGDLAESRFIRELRAIGCEVHDKDESGNQFAFSDFGGHFSGHMDGCALGVPGGEKSWTILEFKTSNDKLFQKLKKEGVKKAKPTHYCQMTCYMGYSGMKRALYLVSNKDDDSLYSERIQFNKEEFDALIKRAERIITSSEPPDRCASRPDYYECSYCDAKEICWGGGKSALPVPAINCRQCCHATATVDGNACWKCEKHKRGLSPADQSRACNDHLVLPGLISFATPVDYKNDSIVYENNSDKKAWRCGGENSFSTKELMQLSPEQLINLTILKVKEVFDATVERVWKDEDSDNSNSNIGGDSGMGGNSR
jgi:hypothetical protein